MKKKSKGKKWIPWVALVLAATVLAALPVLSTKKEEPDSIQATLKTAQAELRDVDSVLVGGGQLESSGVFSVEIPENVKIKEYLVGNGDTVLEGEPIARVDTVSVMTAITGVQDTLTELAAQINDADNASATVSVTAVPGGTVKKIYAAPGASAADAMLQYGALAVISLDDTMAVQLEIEADLSAGDRVTVQAAGEQVTGRVKSNVNGTLTVTVEDDGYEIGTAVTVSSIDGETLGSGELYVYNPWNALAYSGTVTRVTVKEGQTVKAGQSLFTVTESGNTPEYQRAIDKRQKYEALMQDLFQMYRSGVITAPCDGIVSGVNTQGTYMMAFNPADIGARVVLLADEAVTITTASLPGSTQDAQYVAFLQASKGSEPVTGTWRADKLPGGLTLDAATGMISGVPTEEGSFTVKISFTADGINYVDKDYTIVIEKKSEEPPTQYTAYPVRVTAAGGDVIQVQQTKDPYSITDTEKLPDVDFKTAELTEQAVYSGQTVVDGNFAVGDNLWVILDSDGTLVRAVKVSDNGNPPGNNTKPGNNGKPGGMPNGFSGITAEEEDDSLYSLETLTVATVTSQERMTLTISVDELDITKLYVGQSAQITMNALAGEAVEAVVTSIANAGENDGGNSKFSVELELQKSGRMLPGMNATAVITLGTASDVLCVPAAALYETETGLAVYTGYDEKTKELCNPVIVTIGSADADYVEITAGLSEGLTVFYEVYESKVSMSMMI